MSFEHVMGTVQEMLSSIEAVAAIGAELSLKTSGASADAEIESALSAVWSAAGLPDLDTLAPPQQAMVLGLIRLYFAQAGDLLHEPARPPGWTFTDPIVLEGMGRGSTMIPTLLAAAPELQNVTSLLDIGTGVGLLAVSAAGVWPESSIVGIDVWEPSLDRARENVRGAGLEDRITIRNQDVTALDDVDTYDLAWVPTFFLPETVLTTSLPKIVRSLRPGGWVALGMFATAPNRLSVAITDLRTIRGGGCVLGPERGTELLRRAGCSTIRVLDRTGPAPAEFVIGRRPPS